MQNPNFAPTMLGIVFDYVYYILQLKNVILTNDISEINQSNYKSMEKLVAFLAILEVQCRWFFSNNGRILL